MFIPMGRGRVLVPIQQPIIRGEQIIVHSSPRKGEAMEQYLKEKTHE
jgi:hypothetical protein